MLGRAHIFSSSFFKLTKFHLEYLVFENFEKTKVGQVGVIFPSFSSLDPTLEYIVHWECLLCQLRLYTSGSIISLATTAAVGDSIKAVFSSILWLV